MAGFQITSNRGVTIPKTTTVVPTGRGVSGEVVTFGNQTSTTSGNVYYLDSIGDWISADCTSTSNSTGLIAIALTNNVSTDGMLIRGYARFLAYNGFSTGNTLFLSDRSGEFAAAAPSTPEYVIRVVGYKLNIDDTIYFNPDLSWTRVP